MIYRSLHSIFEPSGQPIPSEEEVRFKAREIVQRSGWGLALIEMLRKMTDPYWREAVTRCLMEQWQEMVRDKDEMTYYYDSDGDVRYCWMDAEYDFGRIIRRCAAEQVDYEQAMSHTPEVIRPVYQMTPSATGVTQVLRQTNIYIEKNEGPIITDPHVTVH